MKEKPKFFKEKLIPPIVPTDNPDYNMPDDKSTLDEMNKLNEEHKNKMKDKNKMIERLKKVVSYIKITF